MINILFANLMIVFYLYSFGKKVLSSKRMWGLEVVLFVLLEVSSYFHYIEWRYVVVMLGVIGYVLIKYMDTTSYKLLMSSLFIGCLVVSEVLSASLMHMVIGVEAMDYKMGEYTLLLVFECLVFFVLLYGVYIGWYRKKYLPKYTWMLVVLPVSSVLLMLNLKEYFMLFKEDVFVVMSIFGVLVSNVVIFYLYFKVLDMYVLEKELRQLEMQYDAMSNLYGSSASFLHEVTHRLFKMKNMETKVLKYEVDGLCSFLLQQFRSTQTNCLALQKAINRYMQQIIESGIQIKIMMDYIAFEHLDVLFMELIELGIAACKECVKERYICFKSDKNHCVVLHMECAGYIDGNAITIPNKAKMFCEKVSGTTKLTIVFEGDNL